MGAIDARGLRFDVTLGGAEDGAPVLLLHGFPQNSGMWDAVSPALHAVGLRTIAPDQRGYSPGARPPEVSGYAQSECVADAVAILDALDVDRAHVVGHDWGAVVGWGLAARFPERVRTLTALSVPHPRAYTRALLTSFDQLRRSRYILLFRSAGRAEDLLLADDARRLREVFAGSGLDAAGVDRYVAPLRAPGALTAALNWYRAMRFLGRGGTGKVGVPTTYVWSSGDVAVGRVAARNCAREVTGEYRFVELPGVSHWMADQVPGAVAEAVIDRAVTRS
ncbi:alpha/beta hydrolase [Planosporangium flavigriseum]|uniref:Epoxide hydrolase n=1 Tax=Planosporangium flavigriseum TaxID=373681 RepID=A0A8J3LS00_9ACTN|nr:alpha/beta hydrolase [Planosporangium flavigriseum]NJC67158.1 alpha/beta hydrolase [Planosporangium flavigriseum]GIG75725.1 epoxide hydrolase [Planosporangium flavigriseum]